MAKAARILTDQRARLAVLPALASCSNLYSAALRRNIKCPELLVFCHNKNEVHSCTLG